MTELASRFRRLFGGLDRAYGTYDIKDTRNDGKRTGVAVTKQRPVTDELWVKHLSGEQGIGIVPIRDDSTVVFGAIDVDVYDQDPAIAAAKIEKLKLPLVPCRSKSGGVHAYCFALEPVSAKDMRDRLQEMAAALGQPRAEIFPKQAVIDDAATGNWINMPYFNGVAGMRYAILPDGDAIDVEEFCDFAERHMQPKEFFLTPLNSQTDEFSDAPPCIQALVGEGFPEGGRNKALHQIAIYLKKKHPNGDLIQIGQAFNQAHMNPPLSESEVRVVMESTKKKSYHYKCREEPFQSACNAALCRTRKYGVRGKDEDGDDDPNQLPVLGSLRKLLTNPPIWFWDVDGTTIQLTTEELQSPRLFQKRVMEQINVMPALPKAVSWESIVNSAMKGIVFIDAPEDASTSGQLMEHLEKFCTGRSQANTIEEVLMGKPFTGGGKTYFRMQDFVRHMNSVHFKEFKPNEIAAIFKTKGIDHQEIVVKNRAVTVWVVDAFDPVPDGFDLPARLTEEEPKF